ncbi:MAG: VOC family protein [Pseudomonadota bacterium]
MFTHVMVGTNDKPRANAFYTATLGALDLPEPMVTPAGGLFFSHDGCAFGVGAPLDGKEACHANGGTIGFRAISKAHVDAFHAAGLANGGTCEGPPGPRPHAPGDCYAAYVRDPDGNKICAFYGIQL